MAANCRPAASIFACEWFPLIVGMQTNVRRDQLECGLTVDQRARRRLSYSCIKECLHEDCACSANMLMLTSCMKGRPRMLGNRTCHFQAYSVGLLKQHRGVVSFRHRVLPRKTMEKQHKIIIHSLKMTHNPKGNCPFIPMFWLCACEWQQLYVNNQVEFYAH